MGCTYVYAVLEGEPQLDLDPVGIPDGSGHVTALPAGGFTAVVGEYDGPALDALSKAERLRYLVIHQRVIEQVLDKYPVLPVKFGTILRSLDEVREVLISFRSRLEKAFEEVDGAVEIDLSATWDLGSLFKEIKREPEIATLLQPATEVSERTLLTRIRVGELVHEALERRRKEYRHRTVDELAPLIRDAQPNPLPSDEVVLNIAFLVERARLADVAAAVDRLGLEFENRMAFRYVGPLPPYSFATISFCRLSVAQVASAAQVLGLSGQTTRAEVRSQYRTLAAYYHPDRNPGDSLAQERFAALAEARDILMRYLGEQSTRAGRPDEDQPCMLTLANAAQTLVLEVTRHDTSPELQAGVRHESALAT
jgi:hypothetical protein